MPFSYTHFYPNLLLEVPKLPELWSLESSSSFRIRDYEDSNKGRRICFYFLFEICPTKTASWRTLKFGQWFLQKLEKGSSEYFLLFHHFQLLSLFPEYTHPPPLTFLWKGATCLRLKKEHSYTNCCTKAKLDFGSLKKILEEPWLLLLSQMDIFSIPKGNWILQLRCMPQSLVHLKDFHLS